MQCAVNNCTTLDVLIFEQFGWSFYRKYLWKERIFCKWIYIFIGWWGSLYFLYPCLLCCFSQLHIFQNCDFVCCYILFQPNLSTLKDMNPACCDKKCRRCHIIWFSEIKSVDNFKCVAVWDWGHTCTVFITFQPCVNVIDWCPVGTVQYMARLLSDGSGQYLRNYFLSLME